MSSTSSWTGTIASPSRGRTGRSPSRRRYGDCARAYACHCLTLLDLPNKAAERRFLERFPLPDDVRPWLWLDDPADWSRIEDAAGRWLDEHLATVDVDDTAGAEHLLEEWWRQEVLPTAHSCHGADRVWLDDYLCALRDRDTGGCCLV